MSILSLYNDDGNVTHFAAIERDVTEQKKLENKLRQQNRMDPLTNVFNRREFGLILSDEYSRFCRTGDKYALLMLDVDHFKSINDCYSHDVGDQALIELAFVCKNNLRVHDKIARMGGEEFCILLPSTSISSAIVIGEKLRECITNNTIKVNDKNFSMTVSIGVSEPEKSDNSDTDALKRADTKLYKAKNCGRNKVTA